MTYLVLARKWRPRSFDTLVGQDHVVRALTHALDTQRLHHAWLITGTRGVGKTTLSRILAKSLNCEKGITSTPCGQCRACTEIDAGRYVDYVELDAASNRGVDEMTQLLEQAVYAPSSARFKVYMIDEVHMLTGHAFNAMLKTLEEPPAHVKFILATTDPQKIPVTVLSRCLQFNLKHMTVDAIVQHLRQVLTEEGMAFDAPALRLLAQAAEGSMRDALSLTDQAIAYSAGNLTLDAAQGMLGTIDQRHLVRLLKALTTRQASQVLAIADELASRGLSYSRALADLAVLLSHVAIEQRVPGTLSPDDPLAADVQLLAASLHPDLAQLYYSVAVHSRKELSLAPDEYAGFVMACLRLLSLTPEGVELPEPPPTGGGDEAGKQTPPSAEQPPEQSRREEAPRPVSQDHQTQHTPAAGHGQTSTPAGSRPVSLTSAENAATAESKVAEVDVPAWEALPEDAQVSAATSAEPAGPDTANVDPDPEPEPEPEPKPQLGSGPPAEAIEEDASTAEEAAYVDPQGEDVSFDPPASELVADYGDDTSWEPVLDDTAFDDGGFESSPASVEASALAALPAEPARTKAQRPSLARMDAQQWPSLAASLPLTGLAAELARQSEWVGVQGDTIILRADLHSLVARPGQARLRTVLTEHFGKVVQLKVEFGKTGDGTAHAVEEQRRAVRQKEAEAAVANDPFVRTLVEEFGATVMPGSIVALDNERVA